MIFCRCCRRYGGDGDDADAATMPSLSLMRLPMNQDGYAENATVISYLLGLSSSG